MCQGEWVFDDRRPASGDGFMRCSDGHVRWGIYGAAGVVFVIREADGPRVMVQKRSKMAHEGGTWSCAGGALDQGEMPLEGALREASEEVGDIVGTPRLIGQVVFQPATDWCTPAEVEALPLHAGFAAAWPELKAIVTA